ncbi:MAG: class I adenylate-forming enzyme family protein [Pseudomonadota bacterium]
MILASEERIREYTDKGVWVEKTLLDDFREHVRAHPARTAVVDPVNKMALLGREAERITHAELNSAVEGTAAALAAAGVRKDDIILVQLPNCWELAMLYLAAARVGGVISPTPMQWRAKELKYVAGLTEAKAFIGVEDFHGFKHLEMAREVQKETPTLRLLFSYEDVRRMAQTAPNPELDKISLCGNDIFTICWTSGTEAQPKGCPLSHNNWRCQASLAVSGGALPGDVMLTAGPLVNMGAVGTVLIPWMVYGGTVVLHHPFEPALLLKQLAAENIQYTLLVPAVLNLILKHPLAQGVDLSSIRSITVGSAPPSLWSLQEFKKRWNIDIGNIWGQNEGTAIVSGVQDIPDMEIRVDSLPRYGAPGVTWPVEITKHLQTKVVGAMGEALTRDGEVGELLYRGPNVISGYYRRPDLNEKSFDDEGYIRTGDLFQIRGDRYLKFFDRAKDIIIRGGMNISAQEVENLVLAHPAVQDAAAVGVPDDDLGERTCVFVTPKPGQTVTLEDLKAFMKEQGAAVYKTPERLELVDAIPRNPVGKILKRDLRAELKKKLAL